MKTKVPRKVVLEESTLEHILGELDESRYLLRKCNRRLVGTVFILCVMTTVMLFNLLFVK